MKLGNFEIKSKTIILIGLLIFYITILFFFSGIDYDDTGLLLTNYLYTLSDISQISYSFGAPIIFTNMIGGFLMSLTHDIGYLGMRIVSFLIYFLHGYIVFQIFKNLINKKLLLLGIVTSFIVLFNGSIMDYYQISALFFSLSVYILYIGIKKDSLRYFIIAGLILGLNIFSRLPNIVSIFAVSLAILLLNRYIHGNIKSCLRKIGSLLIGSLIGIGLIILCLFLSNNMGVFISGIKDLFDASTNGGHHSIFSISITYLKNYFFSIICLGSFLIIGNIIKKITNKYSENIKYVFLFLLSFLLAFSLNFYGLLPNYGFTFLFFGLFHYIAIILFFSDKTSKDIRFLIIMIVAVVNSIYLGSNCGIRPHMNLIFISLPLIIFFIITIKKDYFMSYFIVSVTILFYSISNLTLIFFGYKDTYFTQFDKRQFQHRLSIIPKLKGIYLNSNELDITETVYKTIKDISFTGERILVGGTIGFIHYITDTKSFLNNPKPYLYPAEKLTKELMKYTKDYELPKVIVKFNGDYYGGWYMNKKDPTVYIPQEMVFSEFINKFNYIKVLSGNIEIYKINESRIVELF